ncbi:MAG: phosphatidylserine decarboxylase [Burkholderiaceae bacterium]|nr:phosphatidylserine decarboxylase [Burkholderiaceae bacterium]
MNIKTMRDGVLLHEGLNFVLTNRIPRLAVNRAIGWFSRIESPWLTRLSVAVWRWFTDLDLSDAREQRFGSLHAVFTRELRPGARPIDPDRSALVSPCDAIVGACGDVQGLRVLQTKGFPYTLDRLFGSAEAAAPWRNGCYATLRLTSSMYHRFHAPVDARMEHVTHIRGDAWNVNPSALKRVPGLYCLNERAVIRLRLPDGESLALVPVGAILVASIRLHAPQLHLHQRYEGADEIACDVPLHKGQELGWFEHGSTIVLFAPPGFVLRPHVEPGLRIRMGEALMTLPVHAASR